MEKNNSAEVLNKLLKVLKISINQKSIREELHKHPDFNSFLAISDVLTNFNVPKAAYEIEREQLTNVPLPFICCMSNKEFLLVTKMDNGSVTVSNEKRIDEVLDIGIFKTYYSGSVLIAEKRENSGEINFKKLKKKEVLDGLRIPVVITGVTCVLLLMVFLNISSSGPVGIPLIFAISVKIIGTVTAILLLIQSLDENNPIVQKLCGGDNIHVDCNAILTSKAAKLSEELSWSEIGFFYFTGTLLVLLFNNDISVLYILSWLNLFSLPYTLYSIYYQWRRVRKWCVLCCTVQVLLWIEFFNFLPIQFHIMQLPDLNGWGSLVLGMALPILFWIFIKPYLVSAKQVGPIQQQLNYFKYNNGILEKQLDEQPKYSILNGENSIILGNREAKNILTMVSNPYCEPCAKAHRLMETWLMNNNDLSLQIVFSINHIKTETKIEVLKHLMSLQRFDDENTLREAINSWYDQDYKDYDRWAAIHPSSAKILNELEILKRQSDWCRMAQVTSTPTFFINGKMLPPNYEPLDLKYFI